MLLRFAVENFLSFKDMTEFNMSAGKLSRHNNHIALCNKRRILKGAFIFGANASGKTNLIRAISFAKNIVARGVDGTNCDRKYFRINSQYKEKPSVFQFDFFANGHFYSYGFALTLTNKVLEEEWLYQLGDDDKCIFLRTRSETCNNYQISTDLHFSTTKQKSRFDIYADDFKSAKMNQTCFLSDVAMRITDDDVDFKPFLDVIQWFTHLIIIFPESCYNNLGRLMDDDIERTRLENLLNYFDTGIEAISEKQIEFDKAFSSFPPDVAESIKTMAQNTGGSIQIEAPNAHARYEIKNIEGQLEAFRIVTNHGNDNDLFEYADESDGTQRLFDLIPIFQRIYQGYIFIIDELDRSLHTKAVQEFIKYFYQLAENSQSQLIVTTHDSNIMDLDYLRQDEIWFIDRQHDHSSNLYSLNKFRERFDKKIEKEYLLGRYGAIPIFRQSALETNSLEDGDSNAMPKK